jgi:hypothetical protein
MNCFALWTPKKVRELHSSTLRRIEQIGAILREAEGPLTVRAIHYAMVKAGLYENTKQSYGNLSKWATKGREAGLLPWDRIVDPLRDAIEVPWWANIETAVERRIANYRGDRWKGSPYHVEVWIEKRTMIPTVESLAREYAVPLVCGGGFTSTSAIYEAARRLGRYRERELHVLYCGDFDPSGLYMTDDIEERLRAFGFDVQVRRVLLNLEQVDRYDLPQAFEVKATKAGGEEYDKLMADPRAQRMIEKHGRLVQVEVEALDAAVIRELVAESLDPFLPDDYQRKIRREERDKRAMRKRIADDVKGGKK